MCLRLPVKLRLRHNHRHRHLDLRRVLSLRLDLLLAQGLDHHWHVRCLQSA